MYYLKMSNKISNDVVKTRKAILKIYSSVVIIGLLYYLWVKLTGKAIPCLYYLTTGLYCPGCGISRMFISLFKLDVKSAFAYNPVVFCLIILWSIIAVICCIEKARFARSRVFLYGFLAVSVALLLIFCVIRNII